MSEPESEPEIEVKIKPDPSAAAKPARRAAQLYPGAQPLPSQHNSSKRRANQQYLPTLLERLCDDEPSQSSESPEAYVVGKGELKRIIQRDLMYLLNTINQDDLIDAQRWPHVAMSTANYGVQAFAGGHVASKRWEDVEQIICQAIWLFEPRIVAHTLQVRPVLQQGGFANYNVLSFEITGHIHMQPYPLEFTVQSSFDMESSRFNFR